MDNNNKLFANELTTRCKNGLTGCFGDSDIVFQPEKIAAGREKLTLARNIGSKSLQEIAEALYKFDYIKDIDQWLGRYSLYNAEKNNIRWTNRCRPGCT
jgi:hypothetical protein